MNYKQIIEKQLKKNLPLCEPLSKPIIYSTLTNSKRFRSTLCYLITIAFKGNIESAHSSGCALEIIHSYSLIHDDLPSMDDDDIRYNKPSTHKQFNEAIAILTGDGLQALAFKIIANDKSLTNDTKIKLIQILSNSSFAMANGQALDVANDKKINITELNNIYKQKTGALIKASIQMGGIIANASNIDNKLLTNFANNLGLAYQIQDDVLDALSTDENNKINTSDIRKNKNTYVSLFGLNKAKIKYQDLYHKALDDLNKISVNTDELKQLILTIIKRKF